MLRQALKIRVPSYNLEHELRKEQDAQRPEDVFDDDVELEDGDSATLYSPIPSSRSLNKVPPSPASAQTNTGKKSARSAKKKEGKRQKERARRQLSAEQRSQSCSLKLAAIAHARLADMVHLPEMDTAALPVSSTGFTGTNGSLKLAPALSRISQNLQLLASTAGLQLLDWDGEYAAFAFLASSSDGNCFVRICIVLVDCADRIIAVLGGVPPAARGTDWNASMDRLTEAVTSCASKSTFTRKEASHSRGDFAARVAGIGYGGGRERPGNFRIAGLRNQQATAELMCHGDMLRLVGWTNGTLRALLFFIGIMTCFILLALFNAYGHKTFLEYHETLQEHMQQNPQLRPTSHRTVFAATTINYGPQTNSERHRDAGNTAHGWCADTALGNFNPDEGGHLILWDLKYIIRFPPGATILFPSALITHSNIPVKPSERRYSVIQFSSGGLFRWRYNGWCSDKTFLANATQEQKKQREVHRRRRWKVNLQKFTRWNDLVQGDWKGERRTAAGLDETSELSEDEPNRYGKRRRS